MKQRTPNGSERALLDFLGCEQSELRKHSETVYEWRGLYFEMLTEWQVKHRGVPASWYSNINGWKFRQMGTKSAIVKKIRRKI